MVNRVALVIYVVYVVWRLWRGMAQRKWRAKVEQRLTTLEKQEVM